MVDYLYVRKPLLMNANYTIFLSFRQSLLLPALEFWNVLGEKPCKKTGDMHLFHLALYAFFHFVNRYVRLNKLTLLIAVAAIFGGFAPVAVRSAAFGVFR